MKSRRRGDEMHALAQGAVSISVTGLTPGHVVLEEPWPAVVQEFRGLSGSPVGDAGSNERSIRPEQAEGPFARGP